MAVAVALLALYAALALALPPAPAPGSPEVATAVFDVVRDLDDAEVHDVGRDAACPYDAATARFVCGRDDWSFVGRYAAAIGGESGACVWLHPLRDGAVTEVRFADVALPERLRGVLGLIEGAGPGKPLQLEVVLDGEIIGRVEVGDDRGAAPVAIEVPAGTPRGDLTLRYHASRHDWRMGCLRLRGDGQRPAVGESVDVAGARAPAANAAPRPVRR